MLDYEILEGIYNGSNFRMLTDYIPKLQNIEHGKVYPEVQTGDGSLENPFQMPCMVYPETIYELEKVIYRFERENPQYGMERYHTVFKEHNIEWSEESMENVDVSKAEAKVVLALLIGAFRAERFCSGAIRGFLDNGCIQKWLERLKELDGTDIE